MRRHLPDILFCWLAIALAVPSILLSLTEPMGLWARVANLLLPAGVVVLLMSLSGKVWRTVWMMFPLIFLGAFQTVLIGLYGRGAIAVDMFLNLVTTNSMEVAELLDNLWPALIVVFILYLPPLVASIPAARGGIEVSAGLLRWSRRISATVSAVGVVALGMSYLFSGGAYRATTQLYPVNVGYNIGLAIDRTIRTARYDETSAGYSWQARSTRPDSLPETAVLVIGETSRAANWQLFGYGRPTNPRLSARADIIAAPEARSESNTTHKSVPMLLSALHAENFDSIYNVKSVISAFREAGYATAFISNQLPNHSFIDRFGMEADTTLFIKMLPGGKDAKGDFGLLDEVRKIMARQAGKQLIVLHTYGSHFHYRDRYPDCDARFLPDDYSEATASERDRLINAYDNTILSTDRFLDSLINIIDVGGRASYLLYTSDHGEDIFDNGSHRFLHASPFPSANEVHVPMLAWLSADYRRLYPETASVLRDNMRKPLSTSRSFSPTALALSAISTPRTDADSSSLASPDYKTRPSLYLDDHNEAVPLNSIIL